MRILCIGSGLASFHFALPSQKRHPEHRIVVVERNRHFDPLDCCIVFSAGTLMAMRRWGPQSAAETQDGSKDGVDVIASGRPTHETAQSRIRPEPRPKRYLSGKVPSQSNRGRAAAQ